jgi:GNAT superfamily N-acetyltransferase
MGTCQEIARSMGAQESQVALPADAEWVDLTNDLVAQDHSRWCSLVDAFVPAKHKVGVEMAAWLRNCVHEGDLPRLTRAVYNEHLLGFFVAETVQYIVSNRPRPVLAVSRRIGLDSPRTGLLLSFIVRSEHAGEGFGRLLVEDAIGVALKLKGETISGLLVQPANRKLRRVWQQQHHFAPAGSARPRLRSRYLHLPLKLPEELSAD